MGFLAGLTSMVGVAWSGIGVAGEARRGVEAAGEALASGRGPVAAVRAFAAETSAGLDDRAVEAVVSGLREAIEWVDAAAGVAIAVADFAPRVKYAVDVVAENSVWVSYRLKAEQHRIRGWLSEVE